APAPGPRGARGGAGGAARTKARARSEACQAGGTQAGCHVSDAIRRELDRILATFGGDLTWTLERPRDPTHGDFSTNIAMQIAKRDRRNPREIAGAIIAQFDQAATAVSDLAIAGPGFI